MKKSCKNCYFSYCCESNILCDDYIPDIKDNSDETYGAIIEKRRHNYYNEWYAYITDNNDDFE